MTLDRSKRVVVPADTMVRVLDGEAVLVGLASGKYYSLDPVGTDIWRALTTCATIGDALARLLDEYEVDEATLAADVGRLLDALQREQLIHITG